MLQLTDWVTFELIYKSMACQIKKPNSVCMAPWPRLIWMMSLPVWMLHADFFSLKVTPPTNLSPPRSWRSSKLFLDVSGDPAVTLWRPRPSLHSQLCVCVCALSSSSSSSSSSQSSSLSSSPSMRNRFSLSSFLFSSFSFFHPSLFLLCRPLPPRCQRLLPSLSSFVSSWVMYGAWPTMVLKMLLQTQPGCS